MINVKTLGAAVVGAATIGFAYPATAITFTETTDVSNTVGFETILAGGTTEILGTNFGAEDGDLFRFAFDTLTTATLDLDFFTDDANLLLFNGAGNPLFGNDDSGPGLDSQITFTFNPGEYLIGIGRNNFAGFDLGGISIISNDSGPCTFFCDPNGVLAFIGNEGGDTGGPSASYRLTFSVATSPVNSTPIPTPALLPGVIGMGIAAMRKKRQSEQSEQGAETAEV